MYARTPSIPSEASPTTANPAPSRIFLSIFLDIPESSTITTVPFASFISDCVWFTLIFPMIGMLPGCALLSIATYKSSSSPSINIGITYASPLAT